LPISFFVYLWVKPKFKQMALTETQWQQLVDYKQARIEALENRVKTLEALRDAATNDFISYLQAQNETLDFINSKLNSNG